MNSLFFHTCCNLQILRVFYIQPYYLIKILYKANKKPKKVFPDEMAFSSCQDILLSAHNYLHDVISQWWNLVFRLNHWDYKWKRTSKNLTGPPYLKTRKVCYTDPRTIYVPWVKLWILTANSSCGHSSNNCYQSFPLTTDWIWYWSLVCCFCGPWYHDTIISWSHNS